MRSVFFNLICPLFGCLICNGMFASPLKAVLEARKIRCLGELNPVPWVAALLNCIGYTIYGVLMQDYFIFWANLPGMCYALFFSLSAISLLSRSESEKDIKLLRFIEFSVVFGVFFWSFLGMIVGIVLGTTASGYQEGKSLIGYTAMCFSLAYYAAPLSTAVQIVANRDASSLYTPTIITNFINATLWVFYGLVGLNNPIVWAPNAVGMALSLFQLGLVAYYKSSNNDHVKLLDDKMADSKANDQKSVKNPMYSDSNKDIETIKIEYV